MLEDVFLMAAWLIEHMRVLQRALLAKSGSTAAKHLGGVIVSRFFFSVPHHHFASLFSPLLTLCGLLALERAGETGTLGKQKMFLCKCHAVACPAQWTKKTSEEMTKSDKE